jgi:zinc transport system permease protein
MIVVPVLISLRLVTGLRATIVTASAVGLLVALGGVTVAFYTDVAAGGAVVLTGIIVLLSAEIWAFLRKKVLSPSGLGAGPEDSAG